MASNGSSKAHLERLEEAERRKLEMEQKRAPPPRSASVASGSASASGNRGGSRPSRERSQRRNGTYILLLVTTLTVTVGLNVAHHTITGGGAAQVSVRAAEAFLAKHFNTAMDVSWAGLLQTEVHQLENQLERAWRGGAGEDEETAYDRAVRGDGADSGTGGDEDASGMKPWLNKGAREISLADATDYERQVEARDDVGDNAQDGTTANAASDGHTLAGLSCTKYGGPTDEVAKEMVYWSDIPSDSQFVSPFKKEGGGETKYMTFEPDGGGWNNIV